MKAQLAISVNRHKEKLFVDCFHNGESGIAYHRPFGLKRGWQFSHIKSGLGLGLIANNLKQAKEILERLSELDWSFDNLHDHSPEQVKVLVKKVKDLKEEYGLFN